MGKKKRGHPDVEELLARPWCYYCERDFEDLKLLISHQKAKHFKCDRCGRRLNTAGGLSVHMNQVHKETLSNVENALPNRQGLDVEIFGMEGVPDDIVQQHNQRIIQSFYQAQAERFAATGNPPPGQGGPAKKIKVESSDDLKKRLADFRAQKAAQRVAGANGKQNVSPAVQSPGQSASPGTFNSPFAPPQPGMEFPQGYGQPGFPGSYPPNGPPPPAGSFGQYPPTSLPARPPSLPSAPNLPQRPGYQGTYYAGGGQPGAGGGVAGDDIDQLIRMAEAGIKPTKKDADAATSTEGAEEAGAATGAHAEKKSKREKDKHAKMVYSDTEVSPEERMAVMPRYAWVPAT